MMDEKYFGVAGCCVVAKEPPTENRNVELLLDFF